MFRNNHKGSWLFTAGVSLLAFTAGTAHAADAAAAAASTAAAAATDNDQLTDIVVTAERREVNLQQAPLSVTAITGETLKAANITDITGLNGSVPSLVIAKSGGGERIITIRGIGSQTPENTNTQPGVSYHIDGAYIFNSIAASAAFIDVAQVEVLRGPQGTLFGQGSTGGTINVVSTDPSTDKLSGHADGGVGNYHYREGSGALNVPVTDTLAVRGAVQYAAHDGYSIATNVAGTNGHYDEDDQNDFAWRLGAKWAPAPNFSITLNTIQTRSDTHGPAQKNILDPNTDPREMTQDYPGRSYVRTQLYTGVVKWDLPFATIKSITSYQKLHSEQAWDSDGLTAPLFNAVSLGYYNYDHVALWQQDTKSWTQELNLSHSTGPLQWVAGGVYLHSKNSQYINEFKADDDGELQSPLPEDTSATDPRVTSFTYAELSSITRELWAVFGQATYDISSNLKLTAGLRYNHDHSTGTFDSQSGGVESHTSGNYLQPVAVAPTSESALTGKAALDYQFTPNNMVYASYTRGFKPGGINSSAAACGGAYCQFGLTDSIKPAYQKETVDSYEIGTRNRFLDNKLQVNASAFLYHYKNLQFLEEDPVLFGKGISNAPSAREYGIETEATWLPTKHLRLEASGSWLEGKFTSDYYALDPTVANAAQIAAGYGGVGGYYSNYYAATMVREGARQNINGNRIPALPRWQGSFAATWTGDMGPGLLTARAQYIYRGKYESRVFNNGDEDNTPSYSQVNVMLKYEPENSGANITLRVTNLFDVNGVNARLTDPYGSNQVFETYIPPRQLIISAGYKF